MRHFSLFVLLLVCSLLHAQGGDNSRNDSTVVKYLIAQAAPLDADQAAEMLEKAIIISRQINYDRGTEAAFRSLITKYKNKGWVASELRTRIQFGNYLEGKKRYRDLAKHTLETGNLYFTSRLYSKAEDAYKEAQALAAKYDPALGYEIMRQLGVTSRRLKKWKQAGDCFQSAAATAFADKKYADLFWIYQQQAELAHEQGQYLQAFDINERIYKLADSLGFKEEKLVALNNLGYSARYADKLEEAENFFRESLDLSSASKDPVLRAQLLQSLGILRQNRQDYKSAVSYLSEASALYESASRFEEEARVNNFLALVYYQAGDNYRAMNSCEKAIGQASKNKYTAVLVDSYEILSLIHQSLHDYEDALTAFKRHLGLKDSVDRAEQERMNEVLQQQFLLERLEKEMRLLHVAEEMKDLEIAKLTTEKNLETERVNVLQKESMLKTSELRNQELLARETKAQLALLQKSSQLEKQNSEIALLNREKQIQQLQLEKEKLNAQEAERLKNLSEKERKIGELELAQEKSRTRNLFILIGGLGLLILFIIVVVLQLRKKNSRIARQNQVILEDQKIIHAEKEKSERLLLNILPTTVAAELKETGTSKPRLFNEVSIVFTDFAKFTTIAETMSPGEIVETLDKIFLGFDNICEQYGLSRIKTIGDAYMCAAGLPEEDAQHAQHAVEAALEMRNFIREFNRKKKLANEVEWDIRIGINSGPVVAGVVGIKKFAYDIWGDSVNTAARMESSGEIDRVNISGSTYELVKNKFRCDYRGKVSAKNKGNIDMYFVEEV
ncbi:MAG: Adenylate or guanylate cyclase [Bacteroidetes bacterium]|nr:MAG: Adenylate or guanylate cyclase [Bacteroidota bacterium]